MCAWLYVWFAFEYPLIKACVCMFVCSCWISDYDIFYGAFCAPVGLILLFNLSMVLYIICSLSRRKKLGKGNSQKKQIYQLLRITVSLSFLLGITWLFGILVILADNLTFQYIFAILNAIQGFLIFLLNTIGSAEVRKEWSNKLNNIRRKRTTSLNVMMTEKTGTAKSGTSHKRPNDSDKPALLAEGVALSNTEGPWSDSMTSVAERTSSVAAASVSVSEATELSIMENRGAIQKSLEENGEAEMPLTQGSSLVFTYVQVNENVWTWPSSKTVWATAAVHDPERKWPGRLPKKHENLVQGYQLAEACHLAENADVCCRSYLGHWLHCLVSLLVQTTLWCPQSRVRSLLCVLEC